ILLGVNPVGIDAGHLFVYDLAQQEPYTLNKVTCFHCPVGIVNGMRICPLATGVDGSGSLKICATGYEYLEPGERIYNNYLLIWDLDGNLNYYLIAPETRLWSRLDVGDVLISGYPGDKIVLLLEEEGRSKWELYSLDGSKINGWEAFAYSEEARGHFVYVADSDGDEVNEIICVGSVLQKSGKGGKGATCGTYYYIEVFGIESGVITPEWGIIDGDRCQDEGPWDATIG
ncbi:hypothetical protein KA005_16895, partial [bacterium]|nr:hypothetical protein [bacterium]